MEVAGLHENILCSLLFYALRFVDDEVDELCLKPLVGAFFRSFKEFAKAGALDVRNLEFAGHKGGNLFDDASLCFCEVEGVDEVGFNYFLESTIFLLLLVFDFTFKPFVGHSGEVFEEVFKKGL